MAGMIYFAGSPYEVCFQSELNFIEIASIEIIERKFVCKINIIQIKGILF